jgi:hypothetical protein
VSNLKALSEKIPPHDYRPALQGALSWLGNRYLLAEPLNRRTDLQRTQAAAPRATSLSPASCR